MKQKTYSELVAAELSSQISTVISTLQHQGETGRNIESIVQNALRDYIPQRYGVETGFVRSLEDPKWQSRQIDILFTRQDICHPLAVFLKTKVFPIESIVGFMEVIKVINRPKLVKDFQKVKDLKHRTKRHFRMPVTVAKELGLIAKQSGQQTEKEQLRDRISRIVVSLSDLEPRFFYFAFSSKWRNVESICQNLSYVGKEFGVHLHGMMILDKGYFKHTPTDDPAMAYRISYITDSRHAYIAFMHDVIDALQTFNDIPPASAIPIDLYNFIQAQYQQYVPE